MPLSNIPPASGTPAIRVQGLAYSHPKGAGALPALAGLSFTLQQGELLCLAGVNGCGKSTLLCLLAGLYPCTEGQLEVMGVNLASPNALPHSQTSRAGSHNSAGKAQHEWDMNRTALLMQDADMQILGATVEEDLLIGTPLSLTAPKAAKQNQAGEADSAPPCNAKSPQERAWDLALRFDLADHWHSPPHTLSYGQKRKLCLASALMREPAILLLDEPFSGLDYPAIKELRALLQACKESGMTLVISTHDLEPILSFTDSVLMLSPVHPPLFGVSGDVLPHAAQRGVRPPLIRDFP